MEQQLYQPMNLKQIKNVANGYVGLDTNNKIPLDYLYDVLLGQLTYAGSFNPNSGYPAQTNALDPNRDIRKGDYFIANANGTISSVEYHTGDWAVRGASDWQKIDNTDAVASVNGKIGIVNLTGADINVSGVDTTTIANKITAIMTAINDRYTKSEVYNKTEIDNMGFSTNDYTNEDKQNVEKIPTIEQYILDLINDKVDKTSIVDNLTTDDATKVLSAKQGKVLKDLLDATVGNIDAILDSILGV